MNEKKLIPLKSQRVTYYFNPKTRFLELKNADENSVILTRESLNTIKKIADGELDGGSSKSFPKIRFTRLKKFVRLQCIETSDTLIVSKEDINKVYRAMESKRIIRDREMR